MNGLLIDAATVMGISVETLFQKAAQASRFTNYLEVGTYRWQKWVCNEEVPNYVTDFCNRRFAPHHEICTEEGGILHASAD